MIELQEKVHDYPREEEESEFSTDLSENSENLQNDTDILEMMTSPASKFWLIAPIFIAVVLYFAFFELKIIQFLGF